MELIDLKINNSNNTNELIKVLIEYLKYDSTDGKKIRQSLRSKMKELLNVT